MNSFIPIYKYSKERNVSLQNVYRWIREGKIKGDDVKVEIVSVKRIKINKNAVHPKLRERT